MVCSGGEAISGGMEAEAGGMEGMKRPLCPKCKARSRHKRAISFAPYCLPCNRIYQAAIMKKWRGPSKAEMTANYALRIAFLTLNMPLTRMEP